MRRRDDPSPTMLRWYLIQTKPAAESVAQINLERQGYEVYLPRLSSRVRRRGRWLEQIVALFPRYLFLRLDEGRQPLAPTRSTTGVANIVRFGLHHAIVPDRIIHDLRAHADADTGLHRLHRSSLLPGTPVQITTGAFGGLEGVFVREAGADRVVVLLNMLGQDARVRIPIDFVTPTRAA